MGVFDLFKASKEEYARDEGVKDIVRFIETITLFGGNTMDCPMLNVSFGDESMSARFFDCDNSTPCIYQNMLHKKQVDDENAINRLIGEAIHAEELPQGTKIEWHFDHNKNEYDYYVLSYNVKTEYKKCAIKYSEIVKEICMKKGIKIEKQTGTTLRICVK